MDRTTFTLPAVRHDDDLDELTGSVVYRGHRVRSGFVDLYLDGEHARGRFSRAFLGFAAIRSDGTFDYQSFGHDVRHDYRRGVYSFRAFYTPNPSFADYVASNIITVKIT